MPKFKLAVFDIDDTLAKVNKAINKKTISLLKKLQNQGTQICIASGKPADYLLGFVRQIELQDVIIIGDGGYDIYFGGLFPPTKEITAKVPKQHLDNMQKFRDKLKKQPFLKQNDAWLQTNTKHAMLAITNNNQELLDTAIKFFDKMLIKPEYSSFEKYAGKDGVEVVNKGVDKGNAIKLICKELDIKADDVVAIGNGENDVAMFKVAGSSFSVNLNEKFHNTVEKNFNNIDKLLKHLIKVNKN